MAYDPDIHHRRSIRLADYDYTLEGAHFVTVCTESRLWLLGKVIDDAIHPNEAGRMVQTTWGEWPGHCPGVETEAFVIMPTHIHAIIVLTPGSGTVGAHPPCLPFCPFPRTRQFGSTRPERTRTVARFSCYLSITGSRNTSRRFGMPAISHDARPTFGQAIEAHGVDVWMRGEIPPLAAPSLVGATHASPS